MARVKKNGVARTRGRRPKRVNPLVSFTPADAEFLRRYRSVLSDQAKKRAEKKGESIEGREGKAKLFDIGQRAISALSGRPGEVFRRGSWVKDRKTGKERWVPGEGQWVPARTFSQTGKTYVARHELLNLEVALRRFPKAISERARAEILGGIAAGKRRMGHIARRTTREWWNIVDDTKATKFERGDDDESSASGAGFAATYAPPQTCPADCGMRGKAPGTEGCDDPSARLCYAGEHNSLQQWKALHKGFTGLPWRAFLKKLRNTPAKIVRVNLAGDLPADMSDPTRRHLDAKRVFQLALAASAHGRNAFTYTHYDPSYRDNAQIIRRAIKAGLHINLSADNLKDADRKAAMGFDVAVVLPRISYAETRKLHPPERFRKGGVVKTGRKLLVAQGHGITTPEGRKIFFCPSITTTTAKKESKARAKRLAKRLGRRLNVAELARVESRAGGIGRGCATCSTDPRYKGYVPECGKKSVSYYVEPLAGGFQGPGVLRTRRRGIIGFIAHGSAGGINNLEPSRAQELLMAPAITPVARREVEEAIKRAKALRERERAKEAREAARAIRSGGDPLGVAAAVEASGSKPRGALSLVNPRGRRRR